MPNYDKTWTLGGRDEYQAGIVFTQTTINPEACTSNIYFSLYLITTENDSDEDYTYSVTVNGQTFSGTKYVECNKNSYGLIVNGNVTLSHPSNGGAASFDYSVSLDAKGWLFGHAYLTAADSHTFGGFSRMATISHINGFNDEENPVIFYYNPAGSSATLSAAISLDGGTNYNIPFEVFKTNTGNYTFTLDDNDRYVLWWGNRTGDTATATFILRTVVGGHTYEDKRDVKYTIINTTPTLSPVVRDSNSITKALTGNDQKFIVGYSDLYFDSKADPRKAAYITYQSVRCGSDSLDGSSTGTFENIDSDTVYFEVTNSRGYTAKTTKTLDVILYSKLTAALRVNELSLSGNLTFNISGTHFNGSFSTNNPNTLSVRYTLNKNGQPIATDVILDPSKQGTLTHSGNLYEYTYTITGLTPIEDDGSFNTYTLEVTVNDRLSGDITAEAVSTTAMPVYEWEKDNFTFNVPVHFSRGFTDATGLKTAVLVRTLNITGPGAFKIGTLSEIGVSYYSNEIYTMSGSISNSDNTRTYNVPSPPLGNNTGTFMIGDSVKFWTDYDDIYISVGAAWGIVPVRLVITYF